MNADKRLVLVLGLHPSGTSTLTKSLQALGVELGSNFNPATPDNPAGFWEDKDFHALNEEMLKHLHRSWDDLQLLESDAVLSNLEGFFPRALTLLNDFLCEKSVAGLKDPRFSLLLPFWKKVFAKAGIRVSFVIGFRNPLSVAESLSRRDDFPKTKGLWLWTLHHVFIAAGTANVPHLVVDYDKMLEYPRSQLDRIARFLGLAPKSGSLETFCSEFLQPDLRHARHSTADLQKDPDCDPIVLEIYEHFSAESSDSAPVDSISSERAASRWEHLLRPFKGLLYLSSVLGQEKTALRQEAAELNRKIQGMETSLSWKVTAPLRFLERKPRVAGISPRGSTRSYLPSCVIPILLGLFCFVVYNANLRQIGAGDTVPARYLPLILWKYGTFDFDANARLVAHGHPMFTERNRPAGAAGKVLYFEPSTYG
jgi:hypothetical protein